ncbi:methylated-DNA-[protein]-cysteineS-methyltransferase [Salinisphaera sp. PC39]|uniref:MGMT family protein n=1 Tax=Salinisphaera sp. PC39 TaxID=1304156 RepID=UPI00333F3588
MAVSSSYQAIYEAVARVPRGRVATYGDIAAVAGLPGRARQVGYALHRSPPGLPWHRILRADGRIALPADSTAALTQRRRLEDEGVTFLGGRVDLDRYRWLQES